MHTPARSRRPCVHRWRVYALPDVEYPRGRCGKCGAEREFTNVLRGSGSFAHHPQMSAAEREAMRKGRAAAKEERLSWET